MESFTSSLAIMAGAVGCRICNAALRRLVRPSCKTTSSAGRSPMRRILPAWCYDSTTTAALPATIHFLTLARHWTAPSERISRRFITTESATASAWHLIPSRVSCGNSKALGPEYEGDLFVGAARTFLANGYLFHFRLTGNGQKIVPIDPRLEDGVADNPTKFDITESESLLIGTDFGIGTDIETGPNGNLFVVSLSNYAIYEIYRRLPSQRND